MFDLERLSASVAAPLAALAVLAGPVVLAEPARAGDDAESGLGEAIRSQILPCWNPPVGAGAHEGSVRLRFRLKRDGSLDGEPSVLDPSPPASVAGAAVRAVRRCAPLKLPADSFDAWREIIINFDPAQLP